MHRVEFNRICTWFRRALHRCCSARFYFEWLSVPLASDSTPPSFYCISDIDLREYKFYIGKIRMSCKSYVICLDVVSIFHFYVSYSAYSAESDDTKSTTMVTSNIWLGSGSVWLQSPYFQDKCEWIEWKRYGLHLFFSRSGDRMFRMNFDWGSVPRAPDATILPPMKS